MIQDSLKGFAVSRIEKWASGLACAFLSGGGRENTRVGGRGDRGGNKNHMQLHANDGITRHVNEIPPESDLSHGIMRSLRPCEVSRPGESVKICYAKAVLMISQLWRC